MRENVVKPSRDAQDWLDSYEHYLGGVRGAALGTRRKYNYFARALVELINDEGVVDWSILTADMISEFVQRDVVNRRGRGPVPTIPAVRSFLRFLVTQNAIRPGLEFAVPRIKRLNQVGLPSCLTGLEVETMLALSDDGTAKGRRNRALLLLFSRLGLRVGEVARLELHDVDWKRGSILIRAGKTHCERILPLQPDVAEALVSYLRNGRPATTYRAIFMQHSGKFEPLKSCSIQKIVSRLLSKAGIQGRSGKTHLFRHTVATCLINQGVTFKDVADLLGHQSLQATAVYAKLDLVTLSQIALPWPGGAK